MPFTLKKIARRAVKLPAYVLWIGSVVGVIFLFYHSLFLGRIYPNIKVAGSDVSGLTPAEATQQLNQTVKLPPLIPLVYENKSYSVPLSEIAVDYNIEASVDRAYQTYRSIDILPNLFWPFRAIISKTDLPLNLIIDEEKLNSSLNAVALNISQEPVYPEIYLSQGKVIVEKGSPGYEIDRFKLIQGVVDYLSYQNKPPIVISVKKIDPSLSGFEATIALDRANKILDKTLLLSFEFQQIPLANNQLLSLLDPRGGYRLEKINELIVDLSPRIARPPQNPVFVFTEGKVNEFVPAKDGIEIQTDKLADKIRESLKILGDSDANTLTVEIPTTNTPPDYTTADVNNLGIKELLGRGVSYFAGSIASRIHNITLASSKFNGVLVKPGEVFSFNDAVGEITDATGYQKAYIIQDGKTVLGDGGGVCQVSTTLFRAVLNAGLPVVERRAHAYRVSYYEQSSPVGLDATVFSPTTDFKFENNTPAHLLIQTILDTKSKMLVFEIYGTSDGRVASITKPVISGVTPPPDDLYIDDPTLPAGTVKQIDWKAWGAKVSFSYTVVRDGETLIDKVFYSNYQPWQAKFLRGTQTP